MECRQKAHAAAQGREALGGKAHIMTADVTGSLPVALIEMPAAEWAAAVVARHSARTFTGKAVEPDLLDRLESFTDALPGRDTARVVLIRDFPEGVFTGIVGSYGKVVGAPSGLVIIGRDTEFSFQESAGYLGEAAILEATAVGLGACWVAGFFNRELTEGLVELGCGEKVLAVSPLGYPQPRPRAGERVLKRIVGAHKRRPVEEIAPGFDDETWPAWAAQGVRLARAAPSAVNRQPWEFRLELESATAGAYAGPTGAMTISAVERGHEGSISRRLDCGIAMLHFEVGARLMGTTGRWESLEPPEVARYRVVEGGESARL